MGIKINEQKNEIMKTLESKIEELKKLSQTDLILMVLSGENTIEFLNKKINNLSNKTDLDILFDSVESGLGRMKREIREFKIER